MARTESDKEDLIADATALPDRIEYAPSDAATESPWQTVTAGFRKDGSLSLYLDQDPFYQFDCDGGLRRALINGLLYRSQAGTLAELRRVRSEHQTTLRRTDLTDAQLADFQMTMITSLKSFSEALNSGHLIKTRSVPKELCLKQRLTEFLQIVCSRGTDFLSSTIRTRT